MMTKTQFFHSMASFRRKSNFIGNLNFNGVIIDKPDELKEVVASHFESQFNQMRALSLIDLDCNFKSLDEELNSFLEIPFSEEEVWNALISCDGSKAPGPDDFNLKFIQSHWDLLKNENKASHQNLKLKFTKCEERGKMKTVRRDALKPGDHIYSDRNLRLYFHHGIYVGDEMVIHLMGPSKIYNRSPCKKCGFKPQVGIFKTCLDCFLEGHSLYLCEYDVSYLKFLFEHLGSCSTGNCKPADQVVETAYRRLEDKSFGRYNFFFNNCEDFAVYCKTGEAMSKQAQGLFGVVGYSAIKKRFCAGFYYEAGPNKNEGVGTHHVYDKIERVKKLTGEL
ncbi:hypothetical protein REPUB_Repub16aG0113600 [Reevesia pubescens]